MGFTSQSEDDFHWYSFFDSNDVKASMWLIIENTQILDEEDGMPLSIDEELFYLGIDQLIAEQKGKREISRVPYGSLAYAGT